MATDEVMKNYFARFIGHEMMFMVFSSDFHGIFTNLSFIVTSDRCLVFPKVQPSACYEELTYSYFRPTPSAWLLGTIHLVRPLWYYIVLLHILGTWYFVVFSSSFFSRFVTHGQLISSVMTRFDSWLIMRASTLLALTFWCSANRRTFQNACALLASYSGFGFSGEYQGGIIIIIIIITSDTGKSKL